MRAGTIAHDVLLAVTTLSFDIAGLRNLVALQRRRKCRDCSREDALIGGTARAALLDRHQVTVMQATPSTWRLMVEVWMGR